jgi:hypothetical protein
VLYIYINLKVIPAIAIPSKNPIEIVVSAVTNVGSSLNSQIKINNIFVNEINLVILNSVEVKATKGHVV